MLYRKFQDKNLSLLSFGTMRLPLNEDGTIDEAQTAKMVQYAFDNGINYFDTAYPYHGGQSENVIGRILKNYPRDSFYLADKYPGHQLVSKYDPAEVFEKQLKKCQVDYFDFYLLHNVYENSFPVYKDPQWGIIEYFKEQKRLGRIRHLGFSTHGSAAFLREFLDQYGDDMEFCQIQLNYLDWTLQDAKTKYELLAERNIPIIVMEPVRGGRLANLNPDEEARLQAIRPDASSASWCLRYLETLPGVTVILSGMSSFEQMVDNVETMKNADPLTGEEMDLLYDLAEGMKNSVPCTSCRYCTESCPMGLDIPMLIGVYNDVKFVPSFNVSMRVELLPESEQPVSCIGCGACSKMCPQHIDIPQVMKDMLETLAKVPSWKAICKEREEAAKRS